MYNIYISRQSYPGLCRGRTWGWSTAPPSTASRTRPVRQNRNWPNEITPSCGIKGIYFAFRSERKILCGFSIRPYKKDLNFQIFHTKLTLFDFFIHEVKTSMSSVVQSIYYIYRGKYYANTMVWGGGMKYEEIGEYCIKTGQKTFIFFEWYMLK